MAESDRFWRGLCPPSGHNPRNFGRRCALGAVVLMVLAALGSGCVDDPGPTGGQPTGTTGTTHPPPGVATPVGEPPLPAPLQDDLQRVLDETLPKLTKTPGLMAAVWLPGTGAWASTAGVADPTATDFVGRRLATNFRLRAGGITAGFTVDLVLQLVDEGRLGLDDPVAPWFPLLRDGDRITVRQLAGMTSGLADYTDPAFRRGLCDQPQRVHEVDDLLQTAWSSTRTGGPGERFAYSKTNVLMLGVIVEKITGLPFADVLQQRILDPLGMSGTNFPPASDTALARPHPRGFTIIDDSPLCNGVDATDWNTSWSAYAGQATSTLQDLAIWAYQAGTGQRLKSDTFAAQTTFADPGSKTLRYGLGLADFNGWWGSNGSLPGFSAYAVYNPAADVVVVVVATSDIALGGRSPATVVLELLVDAIARHPATRRPPGTMPGTIPPIPVAGPVAPGSAPLTVPPGTRVPGTLPPRPAQIPDDGTVGH